MLGLKRKARNRFLVKDGMLYSENLGYQINFIILLGIITTILYFLADSLPICDSIKAIFKGALLFLFLTFLGFTILLLNRWVQKTYK